METDLFYYPFMPSSAYEQLLQIVSKLQDEFLQHLYLTIENNIDNPLLCVGFLAMNMAVSKSTLNRKLQSFTGLSANELIRQYRLQKAAVLLLSGKNVSEAAYMTGFETPSYFTLCFKGFYKITPKKYVQAGLVTSVNGQLTRA